MEGDVESGTAIAGRYKVVDEIGRGGMGVVYRVEHVNTGERLALKVLLGASKFDPQAIARFKREARASAQIRSEHVVRVSDADTAPELGGSPFIVMELLRGLDLEKYIAREGALAPSAIVALMDQIGRVLQTAHSLGIVHRDLKPENLFLHERDDGKRIAKVLDFGISKFTSADQLLASAGVTGTGSVLGTPLYMAPEQARGHNDKIAATTDVWALGLVVMRLLMAEHYWGAPTMAELMLQLVVNPIIPPSERWPNDARMSPELDAWFLKSCDRDQAKRWPSIEAQVAELGPALHVDRAVIDSTFVSSNERVSDKTQVPLELARTEHDNIQEKSSSRDRVHVISARSATNQRWRWPVVLAIAAIATTTAGIWEWRHRDKTANEAVSSLVASSNSAMHDTERSSAKCTPEAAKLVEDGIVAGETTALWDGIKKYQEAIKIDSRCGAAYYHLALGVQVNFPVTEAREYNAKARELRAQLVPIEAEILDAMAPLFAQDQDNQRAYDNFRVLVERHPEDAKLFLLFALRMNAGPERIEALKRASARLPDNPIPYVQLASIVGESTDEGRHYLEACVAHAPAHVWCRSLLFNSLGAGKDSAALRRYAEKCAADFPGAPSYSQLAIALTMDGAPQEAALEALRQADKRVVETAPTSQRTEIDLYYGDYESAEEALRADRGFESNDLQLRLPPVVLLAAILEQTGRPAEATALIKKTLKSLPAMTGKADYAMLSDFALRAVRNGALNTKAVASLQENYGDGAPSESDRWQPDAYLASSAAEAKVLLESLPRLREHDPNYFLPNGWLDYVIGRLEALTGDWLAAARDVQSALARCDKVILPVATATAGWSEDLPDAYLLLGEASTHNGDFATARDAYQMVIDRWGALKPRAVRAEQAKLRLAALPTR